MMYPIIFFPYGLAMFFAFIIGLVVYICTRPPHLAGWPLRTKYRMPPGPPGSLFAGNLWQWLRVRGKVHTMIPWVRVPDDCADTWLSYPKLMKQAQYGEMTTLRMGTKSWVLLNSSRVVDEIIIKRAGITHERPYFPVASGLVSRDKRFFLQKTQNWKEARQLMRRLMTGPGSKDHGAIVEEASLQLLRACLEEPRKWYARNYQYPISIMYKLLTGISLDKPTTDLEEFQQVTSTFLTSINSSVVEFYPQLTWLPKVLQYWRNHWEALGNFHYNVFCRWWQAMDEIKQSAAAPSFLRDSILQNYSGTDEQAMYLAMLALSAGGDNPRMTLNAWVMSCLSAPTAMEKARGELESVCGTSRLPCLGNLPEFPYICAVVKEVLRWRPTVPLIPQRLLIHDLEFEGYLLPAGTEFLVNSFPVCTHGYENPNEFSPDRWLPTNNHHGRGIAQDLWPFAFSGGRRMCVGYKLAQKELFVAIARLVYCFDIKPAGEFDDAKLNAFCPGEPFPVDITIRSGAHENLIRTAVNQI